MSSDPYSENPVKTEPREEKKVTFDLLFMLKNEEKTIEGVIKSFWQYGKPLYKNLIIGVDDSCEDNTYEIVKSFATDLFHFKWEDNFSKARNIIIKRFEESSDSEWAVFPDGHEYLDKESVYILPLIMSQTYTAFKDTHLIAPYFSIFETSYCCAQKCSEISFPEYIFARPIILRRAKNMKFESAIHNYLYAPYPHSKLMPQMMFEHRMPPRRLQQRLKQRKQMNISGLKGNLDTNKKDSRSLFYLAQTYADQRNYATAIKFYKKFFKVSAFDDQHAEAGIACGHLMINLKRYKEAEEVLAKNLTLRWDRAESYFLLGRIAYEKKQYGEAIHWLKICVDMPYPVTHFFIRPPMYRQDVHDALMDCYAKIGDFRESLQWAFQSLKNKPDCKTMQQNIATLEKIISEGDQNLIEQAEEKEMVFNTHEVVLT